MAEAFWNLQRDKFCARFALKRFSIQKTLIKIIILREFVAKVCIESCELELF